MIAREACFLRHLEINGYGHLTTTTLLAKKYPYMTREPTVLRYKLSNPTVSAVRPVYHQIFS